MAAPRCESIIRFLNMRAPEDLAQLYSPEMEVQVLVGQNGGQRKEVTNSRAVIWTDSVNSWYSFRIPKNAWAEPEDNSESPMSYDLERYADGIGMTGWNFKQRKSVYLAFDFDAIVGHSDKHAKKLPPEELARVQKAACEIPWVTVRSSTAGRGLHLYVFLNPLVDTSNHSEHSALGRAVLGYMSALAGYDFESGVDALAGNIWVWAKKYEQNDRRGLKLIKKGEFLNHVPANWRDHVPAASSRAVKRTKIGFVEGTEAAEVEALSGEFARVPLDEAHRALIRYLEETKSFWWFDQTRHMLVCHTADLKLAHEKLQLRGIFDTMAHGTQRGADHNAFAYPLPKGAWVVRRYTKGVAESPCWQPDKSGYQRIFFNADPDLETTARMAGAVRNERGDFEFQSAEAAIEALKKIKVNVGDVPRHFLDRRATVKVIDDGVALQINRTKGEVAPVGWSDAKSNVISHVIREPVQVRSEDTFTVGLSVDDIIRHLVDGRNGSGWAVKTATGNWVIEQESAVSQVLSHRFKASTVKKVMGSCILSPWWLVNLPFQPEYPGDRRWNRDAAQFRFVPTERDGDWSYPSWQKVLDHCGCGMDDAVKQNEWCQSNHIRTGAEYLTLWIANMFRRPEQPLPYLFFFGPQNSGKSIFHQALGLLFLNKVGYVRGEAAIQNPTGFNGELAGAVLVVVEEVDLSGRAGKVALGRMKDWVGSDTIGLHVKGKTPILVQNTMHFVQCANDPAFCPVFPDDSRVTMSLVPSLAPGAEIPKAQLLSNLEKEASEFLGMILSVSLPDPPGRLGVPVVTTDEKREAAANNASMVMQFLSEKARVCAGHAVSIDAFHAAFCEWIGSDQAPAWTKQRISKELGFVPGVVRGRYQGPTWHYGNVSLDPTAEPVARLIKDPKTETLFHEGSSKDKANDA